METIECFGKLAVETLRMCNQCCECLFGIGEAEETDVVNVKSDAEKSMPEEAILLHKESDQESGKGCVPSTKEKIETSEGRSTDGTCSIEMTESGEGKPKEAKECVPLTKEKIENREGRSTYGTCIADNKGPVTNQPITIDNTPNISITLPFVPYPYTHASAMPQHCVVPNPQQSIVEWVPSSIEEAARLKHKAIEGGEDIDITLPLVPYPYTHASAMPQHCVVPNPQQSIVEWVPSSIEEAARLKHKAIEGGEDIDNSTLFIIRARIRCETVIGKLNLENHLAFVAHKIDDQYEERNVEDFEVCCIAPEHKDRIIWTKCCKGEVPGNAVEAGRKPSGEKLYIGRKYHIDEEDPRLKSLCPGMIQPSHGLLYITFGYKVFGYKSYEVLCIE